jgi:hypothetical protein
MYDAVVVETPARSATSMSVTLRVVTTATSLPFRSWQRPHRCAVRVPPPLQHRCLTLTKRRAMILLIRFSI